MPYQDREELVASKRLYVSVAIYSWCTSQEKMDEMEAESEGASDIGGRW